MKGLNIVLAVFTIYILNSSHGKHIQTFLGQCGGEVKADTGFIEYPYVGNYKNDENCTWTIKAREGSKIKLKKAGKFDIAGESNCENDNIQIFEVFNGDKILKGTYCSSFPDLLLNSNETEIAFKSDGSNTGSGYKLEYETRSCQTDLKEIKVNATVVRGCDWEWGNQDGDGEGTIIEVRPDNKVKVLWKNGNGKPNTYRMGNEGKFDLLVIDPESFQNDRIETETFVTNQNGDYSYIYTSTTTRCDSCYYGSGSSSNSNNNDDDYK